MELEAAYLLVGIVGAVGGFGGAWGAAHQRIKHTEAEVTKTKAKLDSHDERTRSMSTRLERIETNIDWIKQKLDV